MKNILIQKRMPIVVFSLVFATLLLLLMFTISNNLANASDGSEEVSSSDLELAFEGQHDYKMNQDSFKVDYTMLEQSVYATIENDPFLGLSSNPYDYVSEGKNAYYNEIVGQGPSVLPELERALGESESAGLEDYILAIAIEEVTNANIREIDNRSYAWGTADEFRMNWSTIRQNTPTMVESILYSRGLKTNEKVEQLEHFGILALPTLEKAYESGMLDKELSKEIKETIDSNRLDTKTRSYLETTSPLVEKFRPEFN